MQSESLEKNINKIINIIGAKSNLVIKEFFIGEKRPLEGIVIYMNGLANKDTINRDILNPLMHNVYEDLTGTEDIGLYLCKRYISSSNTTVVTNIYTASQELKRGKTIIIVCNSNEYIIVDTKGGEYRSITEPTSETAIRGAKEGFVENLETNISILRRRIKDKSLVIEKLIVGRRSQTDVAIIYIQDIVDKNIVDELKKRLNAIDVDFITGSGQIKQYIEDYTYTPFPQTFGSERPDIIEANLMDGRVAVITEGTPHVFTAPTLFVDFFHAVEDYNQRTAVTSFTRILRILAVFIVITLAPIYLTLLKFNEELIPVKFITPIIQSRVGISLTPFLEILSMQIVIEFLREGGLRLPNKIGQTLSLVGGIIIGDTVVKSKVVSPTTLLIIGITVIATFLIPTYDMALVIRLVQYPMLLLANFLGIFGIAVGWYFLMVHLCSLDSFGVPYLQFNKNDLKDIFIRAPLWKMNKRPESIPNINPTKQTDFRNNFKENNNEQNPK
ncbi:spore germination protein [Clostridium ganghwense]|uniref:Spore germination protein n=1 Tax=Clostridium ganghwense TaxID=312089 RepID=A0ABT4CM67_9CLOT|nr:spore germination protein [Clostridium ganghwense]MCY6370140.1 spore germination protein [Clostridium ganghwense]